jgi:drug/metabolite transporter (DMT)-like permease
MTLASGVLWGTSFVAIQWGLDDGFDPMMFAALRFVVATVAALAFVLAVGSVDAYLLRSPYVWALGLVNAAGYAFQYYGLELTTSTKAALITNLSMVLVAPMSHVWLGERFTWTKAAALVAMVPGVFLLTTAGDLSTIGGSQFLGDMLILCAGASWAVYILVNKRLLDTTDAATGPLTLWIMATTVVFMLPPALVITGGDVTAGGSVGAAGWAGVVYTGVGCSTVAYLLFTHGLRGVTATVSAILLLVQVLVAAALDYAVYGRGLAPVALVGAGIILVAMALVSLGGGKAIGKDVSQS